MGVRPNKLTIKGWRREADTPRDGKAENEKGEIGERRIPRGPETLLRSRSFLKQRSATLLGSPAVISQLGSQGHSSGSLRLCLGGANLGDGRPNNRHQGKVLKPGALGVLGPR